MIISNSTIQEAFKIAKTSKVRRGKVGSIVFLNNGYVLAKASNKSIYGSTHRWTIHSEDFLLQKVRKLRIIERFGSDNLNILVVRWRKLDNSLANAKPCSRCEWLLRSSGIRYYYSNKFGSICESDGIGIYKNWGVFK